MTAALERPPVTPLAMNAGLAQFDRPLPSVAAYDSLVGSEAAR
jgi:hypothetical protein